MMDRLLKSAKLIRALRLRYCTDNLIKKVDTGTNIERSGSKI